jgi:hypothetical protein
MLASNDLAPAVRAKILGYISEKLDGLFGDYKKRRANREDAGLRHRAQHFADVAGPALVVQVLAIGLGPTLRPTRDHAHRSDGQFGDYLSWLRRGRTESRHS